MFQQMISRPNRRLRRGSNRAGRCEALSICNIFARCVAFFALGVITFTPATADEAVSDESVTIRTELITSLPVEEVWHSLNPVVYWTGDPTVSYWQTGHENEPWDGEWRSPGFVMFGTGDIGVVPVAIRIWTKGDDRFLEELSRKETEKGENAAALFGPSEDNVRLHISESSSGEVMIDGKVVGKISYGD